MGFEAPPPPPGFSEEPEEEEGVLPATPHGVRSSATAARVLRRARGRGECSSATPWGSKLRHRRQGSPKSPRKEGDTPPIPDEMAVESDISSIDSLADSLSLLEDEWEPDSDALPDDPFKSNISSDKISGLQDQLIRK